MTTADTEITQKRWHQRSGWRLFAGMMLMKLASWPVDMGAVEWFLLHRAEIASGLALALGLTTGGTSLGTKHPGSSPATRQSTSNPIMQGGGKPPTTPTQR